MLTPLSAFQTRLADIMETLAQTAVLEISKLVELECKILLSEVTRGQHEIDFLRKRLQLMEKHMSTNHTAQNQEDGDTGASALLTSVQEHRSRTEIHNSRTENHSSETEIHSSETEIHSSETEIHSSRMENHSSRTENNNSRTENNNSRTENNNSRTENNNSRTENHGSKMENHSSRTENHSSRTENHSLRKENHSSRRENNSSITENQPHIKRESEPEEFSGGAAALLDTPVTSDQDHADMRDCRLQQHHGEEPTTEVKVKQEGFWDAELGGDETRDGVHGAEERSARRLSGESDDRQTHPHFFGNNLHAPEGPALKMRSSAELESTQSYLLPKPVRRRVASRFKEEKRFACPLCAKCFKCFSQLEIHKRSHTASAYHISSHLWRSR
ncbi:hypothetical protein AMELA_G00246130 [Ameiurus melas]|uniref:C2H2-type domain-containing protein n=1 Tax=Ameiurus melas TaxID=219545 RepID=A0A7J5ZWS1_AMEME|nr:hypothetical protein AMELA_G00246130 [Ameiurus melas]